MRTVSLSTIALTAAAAVALSLSAIAAPDDATQKSSPPPRYGQEGRPTATVPGGGGAPVPAPTVAPGGVAPFQVGNPSSDSAAGAVYEGRRIKRTVPLDPATPLSGHWDLLYTLGDGPTRRSAYCDWDNDYLYLAWEAPTPEEVRFDIDGQDDGWLRGADNLSIQVAPGEGGVPHVSVLRFDAAQNRDRPVWAASPISVAAIKAITDRTPQGVAVTLIAIPRTELIGLKRKADARFGLRIDNGVTPVPPLGDATQIPSRPLLHLTLADQVEASGSDLTVKVSVAGGKDVTVNDGIRAVLEAKNTGKSTIRVARLFLRGSQSSLNYVDAATFTGVVLPPGKSIKREVRSAVSSQTPVGALVLTGGAEWEDGTSIVSLAAFDRVEPYSLTLSADSKPVTIGTDEGDAVQGQTRKILAVVRSRSHDRAKGEMTITIPQGWFLDGTGPTKGVSVDFPGDVKPQSFKVLIPGTASPGVYPIEATVQIGGHTYTASTTITVVAPPPPSTEKSK